MVWCGSVKFYRLILKFNAGLVNWSRQILVLASKGQFDYDLIWFYPISISSPKKGGKFPPAQLVPKRIFWSNTRLKMSFYREVVDLMVANWQLRCRFTSLFVVFFKAPNRLPSNWRLFCSISIAIIWSSKVTIQLSRLVDSFGISNIKYMHLVLVKCN